MLKTPREMWLEQRVEWLEHCNKVLSREKGIPAFSDYSVDRPPISLELNHSVVLKPVLVASFGPVDTGLHLKTVFKAKTESERMYEVSYCLSETGLKANSAWSYAEEILGDFREKLARAAYGDFRRKEEMGGAE